MTSFLPHEKFTWAGLGGINTDIPPVATPLWITNDRATVQVDCSVFSDTIGIEVYSLGPIYTFIHLYLIKSILANGYVRAYRMIRAYCCFRSAAEPSMGKSIRDAEGRGVPFPMVKV